jgi:hypothetical protein
MYRYFFYRICFLLLKFILTILGAWYLFDIIRYINEQPVYIFILLFTLAVMSYFITICTKFCHSVYRKKVKCNFIAQILFFIIFILSSFLQLLFLPVGVAYIFLIFIDYTSLFQSFIMYMFAIFSWILIIPPWKIKCCRPN